MKEYIEREAALNASKIVYIECLYKDEENYLEAEADDIPVVFKRDIEAIPAADVRPVVHSKWEQVEVLYAEDDPKNMPEAVASMFCPKCKRYHNEVFFYGNPVENVNFCPYCGADCREVKHGK